MLHDIPDPTYYLSRIYIHPAARGGMARWRKQLFSLLARNASNPTECFQLPDRCVVSIGTQIGIRSRDPSAQYYYSTEPASCHLPDQGDPRPPDCTSSQRQVWGAPNVYRVNQRRLRERSGTVARRRAELEAHG
jgi:hypothetical protein